MGRFYFVLVGLLSLYFGLLSEATQLSMLDITWLAGLYVVGFLGDSQPIILHTCVSWLFIRVVFRESNTY